MALKEKVTTTRKKKKLLKGTLSDLILVWPHTSVYYHFISFFFFSFSRCPSLSTKIGFGYFHNRLKNIFLSEQKGGKITLDGSVDCRGLAHTLSLSVPLCVNVREIHTQTMDWCVFLFCGWVGVCDMRSSRLEEMQLRAGCQPLGSHTIPGKDWWFSMISSFSYFIWFFGFELPVLSSHSVLLSVQGSYN